MTRRARLMATLRGEPVDRPPVSFYEITGREDIRDNSPFNIYAHPSWHPLIALARDKTDRIVMRGAQRLTSTPDLIGTVSEKKVRDGVLFTTSHMTAGNRNLTARTRRDPDLDTEWKLEPLLKNLDDLKAFLESPAPAPGKVLDTAPVTGMESSLGETGIVMLDTPDPLCLAASLFDMADYTVIAMTEQALFHRLLERFASILLPTTEAVSRALPGRLWRIFGPEYASPPYLPPHLFREYVSRYVRPMVESIQRYGGYARIHSHGKLNLILDEIASLGADGLDPIEPPPQGDVELAYVRKRYGKHLVLFGNLEVSDIENLPTVLFAEKVKKALREGTAGRGRGFVLMPSACPYGRNLSPLALSNYEKIVEIVEEQWPAAPGKS